MPESAEPQNDLSLQASMPEGAVPLESIVCTEELKRRPYRPPDFEKENRAWEWDWVNQQKSFPLTPAGDPLIAARALYHKYREQIGGAYAPHLN